ncbi:MAG: outer membrane lipoprotein-sorting protein [Marinilabiliaceae bacterium]|jgi:outer membrane lipoprotein-sorting protein|nr:outer membrane lipoprotein-sorting protein [Marinilabiliaceae bacterium]
MKRKLSATLFYFLFLAPCSLPVSGQDATEIVRKANEKFNGEESSVGIMSMTIVRPTWERTITFKNWTKGTENALTLITAPARDKGQTFLKRGTEMWTWTPSISRLTKLPPSMMSQGWMGSDYTNDDILKESSVVNDYTHEILGQEETDGRLCYKIKLTAKEDAAVIWGHQIRWIDTRDYLFLKSELYDEDGYLIRTEIAGDIKIMDGRLIPTRIELIPAEEEGQKTIVVFEEIEFNREISDSFFSQQNMRRVR